MSPHHILGISVLTRIEDLYQSMSEDPEGFYAAVGKLLSKLDGPDPDRIIKQRKETREDETVWLTYWGDPHHIRDGGKF